MNLRIKQLYINCFFVFLGIFVAAFRADAFSPDFFAPSSVLAEGKWVKIKVENTGMQMISNENLRAWGFNDPSKVRVYGYGGRRIADRLSTDTYVDDLPLTPSFATSSGIAFYGVNALDWIVSTGTYYHGYQSPYSSYGYYFLTDSGPDSEKQMPATAVAGAHSPETVAQGRIHHEKELIQATSAGPLFVGESFSKVRSNSFSFSTPGRVAGSSVWLECVFFHVHVGSTANLKFTVDGSPLDVASGDKVPATSDSHYAHGSVTTSRHTFVPASDASFKLELTYVPALTNVMANLDYLSVIYERRLELPAEGWMEFWSNSPQLSLGASGSDVTVWDVTDPADILLVNTSKNNGRYEWTSSIGGMRAYVAWRNDAKMNAPAFDSNIANQNIHGEFKPVDMVIITPAELIAQANRIARLHRLHDGMEVEVIDQEKIYNEFSSGACDISGLRKYLKMVYDRSDSTDRPLKYALLLGRATLDQRRILPSAYFDFHTTPWWVVREPRQSMNDNDGYGTDDFLAMLEDGSGTSLGLDILSVAVGRMPILDPDEGEEIIDKLEQYMTSSKKTGWKNRMIVLADDEDSGEHLHQAESLVSLLEATKQQQNLIDKIYIDAYELTGGVYPQARNEMYRLLDDGAVWWIYTGHANNHSWTGEGMLTFSDINNMYLKNVPFVLASTCDFLRWDGEEISGGEIMYKERFGGSIGMISATRPVYISDNALFLNAFGRQALSRDDDGNLVRAGEAYRRTKNDIRNKAGNITSNTNRLRFVYMGDPAMALVTPSNIIEVTSINGVEPNDENQATIPAMSNTVIEGRIVHPDGSLLSDFNGVVSLDIFDADYSVTTLAHGEGVVDVFDRHGEKLFAGSTTVENGKFSLRAAMPSQIADNFRPATMSLYAYATNSNDEAIGTNRKFFVYGFDDTVAPDTEAPVISSLVLNHADFKSGDCVNPSPMVIAAIEDNIGINLSQAGVGQQMALTIDGFTTFNDVSSFYTPAHDGSPSGVINYPLEDLTEGFHTLSLRVFDTSGNTTLSSIEFEVSQKALPKIIEVYTDANPAHTSASFFVRHDRPDTTMDVSVTVYNLMGQPVWTGSAKGVSDMDVSAPVTWNLCDNAGRRVQRGIYLYRASISADGETYQSASQRIAVAAE